MMHPKMHDAVQSSELHVPGPDPVVVEQLPPMQVEPAPQSASVQHA